jgi:hypothetical protein
VASHYRTSYPARRFTPPANRTTPEHAVLSASVKSRGRFESSVFSRLGDRSPKSPIFRRSLPVCAFLQRSPLAFHLGRYLPEYLGYLHGWVASLQAAGRILEPAGEAGKE